MNIREWIASITEDGTNEIARKSGIAQRTFYNQLDKGTLTAENVIRVAITYRAHPLRALIDTGFIDPAWASIPDIEAALRLATEDQLADEVLRRMKISPDSTVFDAPVDDLAARRSVEPTPDVPPLDYVADDTDTEPEEGDEGYHDGP